MHHIQKLEIVGFKSFCDRTEIVFNEGITAVVGPNGCGKSNIADGISWVVGEQSAKSLRTDRMEGVIFNGTQARKATSMAEVVLTLRLMDNFQVPEGLHLNPEGFTVGRRLYRSGESEYYLDGRRCRLRDIQTLFEGTGLGPNSYALIEQGRVGQILSSKPADRRSLIEEAARISLFKTRRYSAELKLELAQQNLLRINDIIHEVTRQLDSLKRQAARARRYARFREELRNLQRLKMGMEQRRLAERLEECGGRFNAALEQEQRIVAELNCLQEERSLAQESFLRQEDLVNRARERLGALKLEAERAGNLRRQQSDQKKDLQIRVEDLERDRLAIETRAELTRKEEARVRQAMQQLQAEIEKEQLTLDQEQARSELIAQSILQTENRIESLRSFLLNHAGKLSDLRNLQARCNENLQRMEARSRRLEDERQATTRERAGLQAQLDEFKRQAEESALKRGEISASHEQAEQQEANLASALERTSADVTALQEEHSLVQHRYSSLEEVERRRSNYSEGVQKFLSTQLPGEEIHSSRTLADHIETDPRYETAVEDYLNDPLQYILVDGIEDAVDGVERLKRIGAGKCTFLTLRNGRSNGHTSHRTDLSGEGVIGYLDELLRMQEDVRHAFERALPEFAATVMVADLPTAFRVAESSPGTNFLTLSGEAYSPRGTLSAVGERKAMAGFLAVKREKRELEVKLESLRRKLYVAREQVTKRKEEQAAVQELLKKLVAESRRLEVEAVGFHHAIGRVEAEIQKIDQSESVAAAELTQLSGERQVEETKLKDAASGIAGIESETRSGEEELRDLAVRLESLRGENLALSRRLAALASTQAVRQERRSSHEADLRRLSGEHEEVARRFESNRQEKESALARIAALDTDGQEAEAKIEKLARDIESEESTHSELQKRFVEQREGLSKAEERLRVLHGERESAMDARGRIEIEKTRLENDLEHLARDCQEEFHLPLLDVASQIPEGDWQRDYEEVCGEHDELRKRLETFGAINMRALEEYQELDERYQFQSKQRADIEKSIADTQKAIAEINRRSVEQFQEAFNRIRENFIEVFQLLFKGGECDIRLLDDADVLESGIDIIAQPPGKRLQNVLLLSGGEKALTALALLIAIFRYRPSPFCVLDEVDAPLDDANVGRFTQLIIELSKETQFILITHNKRTMEIARTLYGVTMEEPGVSKIVSVDLRSPQQVEKNMESHGGA